MTGEAAPGRVLAGRYELGALLGAGGMASVFLGTDRVLEREVAVKVLHPRIAQDPAYVERFRREAKLAATIAHPGVVSVFDTGEDDGVRFIVMERVEGHTLADEIAREGALEPERAAAIAVAVCDALAAAHVRGLVHRDVKPGNIMLDADGRVKVMDFGIARAETADTLTQTATVMGTAAYISPEQARGERADARSDIYSLGCVLYAMLTGEPPFSGDSAVVIASRHLNEAPRPPSRARRDVSPALDAVVLRALAKEPAGRYQDAQAIRAALRRAIGEETTQPLGGGPRHAAARPELRRALGSAALIAGLLGLVATGYLLTTGGGERPGRVNAPDRRGETSEPAPEETPTPTTPPQRADAAYAALFEVLTAAEEAGEIDSKAAEKIGDHAFRATEHALEGRSDQAIHELEKATEELAKATEKGAISESAAVLIDERLSALFDSVSEA